MAALFRIEGIAYLIGLPLLLIFASHLNITLRLRQYLIANSFSLIAIMSITVATMISNDISMQNFGRLKEIFTPTLYQQLTNKFFTNTDIMADQVLGSYLNEFAVQGFLITFAYVLVVRAISTTGLINFERAMLKTLSFEENRLNNKQVTILVPNYKTPEITKICMRLIRRYTNFNLAEVIVIDNNSNDASLDYLKSLKWVTLIERKPESDDTGPLSHSRALDLALSQVKTPYVLSIHTDTFIKHIDWLDVLIEPMKKDPTLAGVSSWKLESKTAIQKLGIQFEQTWKYIIHKLFSYQGYNKDRLDVDSQYLRSHCALYRTDLIKALNTNFSDGDQTAGKIMHQKITKSGYRMLFLESTYLGKYIDHLNHATMVLNPELGSSEKMRKSGNKRIQAKLRGIDAAEVLANTSLDL